MEIENYVMENFVNKIVRTDSCGRKYIEEDELDKLDLTSSEKSFIIDILAKYKIKYEVSFSTKYRSSLIHERLERDTNAFIKRMNTDSQFRKEMIAEHQQRHRQKQLRGIDDRLWR